MADGSFKKQILVGIKLSRYLVVCDLALKKNFYLVCTHKYSYFGLEYNYISWQQIATFSHIFYTWISILYNCINV